MKRIAFGLVILFPILEVIGFGMVGSRFGVLAVIGGILGGFILGAILLRALGRDPRLKSAGNTKDQRAQMLALGHTLLLILSGLLFIFPGFFSDLLAALLVLRPLRTGILHLIAVTTLARIIAAAKKQRGFSEGWGDVVDADFVDVTPQTAPPLSRLAEPDRQSTK